MVTIARRNVLRNIRRTVLCIVAVAIAVFFTILMQSMMEGMIKSIEELVQVFDTGHISIVSAAFDADREYLPVQYPVAGGRSAAELTSRIRALPGIRAALPRITAYATLQDSVVKHALLWGINIEEETGLNFFNITNRSNGLTAGRYPEAGSNECAIGIGMAEKMGLKIGDRIPLKTVSAQFSDKMWAPVITGIFAYDYQKYDRDFILVDFSRLQRLLVLGDATQQVFVFADKVSQSRAVARRIAAILEDDDLIRDWQDNYFVVMMRQSMIIYYIVEAVFVIVASFLIVNTQVMTIHERIREIGMMGSLGMTGREIVEVFFLEAVFLSVLGSLAGVLAGGSLTFAGSFFPLDVTAMTGGGFKEMPVSGTVFLRFSAGILFTGFFFGVAAASVCTLIPSLKSASVEPVEAMRR
jgi:putative ABC transport system permease protein